MPFLRLIRFQNLLIIIATQYVMRYCIIVPFLRINHFAVQLDDIHFALLVLATVLLAAGGYIVNDYFDVHADRLNKPERVIIGDRIGRNPAMSFHLIMNITGVGIGVYLSFYIGYPGFSLLFLLTAGLLWFYSTLYKRQFLIGNLLISILTAMVPLLVILYEMPLLNKVYGDIMIQSHANFNYIFFWISGFGFFAFMTTLLREIIKDSEDFEGDSAYGMNTIPIALGTNVTKIIILSLIFICVSMLLWVLLSFILFSNDFTDYLSGIYFILFLLIPFVILFIRIINARSKRDYYLASQLTKGILVAGIMYAFLVRYIILYELN